MVKNGSPSGKDRAREWCCVRQSEIMFTTGTVFLQLHHQYLTPCLEDNHIVHFWILFNLEAQMCSISVREAATFLRRSRIDRRREKWPGVAPTVNRMKDEGRKEEERERANSPPTFLSPTPSLPPLDRGGSVPFRLNFAAFHSLFRHGMARTRPPL